MQGMGIPQQSMQPLHVAPRTAVTLYIGDLDEQINEEMLYLRLAQYGQIFTLKISRDINRKSRGFAFVTFYLKTDAEKAKAAINHKVILQNRLRVTFKKDIKALSTEANLFVKSVPNTVQPDEFENFFNQFGEVFSSKLNIFDHSQGGTGYGYIQFENKESVQKCLEQQKVARLQLQGKDIEVMAFEKRDNRQNIKTNIYLKNLPSLQESELISLIKEQLSPFGAITSLLVKVDPQVQKPFAFVCYAEPEQAQKAYTHLE